SEGTFYAKIIFSKNGDYIEQDSRPSDAIALAVRFRAPIYVKDSILEEAGILSEEKGKMTGSAFSQGEESFEEMTEMDKIRTELNTGVESGYYAKTACLRNKINKIRGEFEFQKQIISATAFFCAYSKLYCAS